MSKAIPPIQKYMTMIPKSIGFDRPLSHALETMHELRVRHLPVLKGGKLVGVLSDRDIKMVLGFDGTDAKTMTVEEAYSTDPYFTTPAAPVNEVARQMADKKYGCAIVMDNDKLVGIFTETDALRALAELFETRLKH